VHGSTREFEQVDAVVDSVSVSVDHDSKNRMASRSPSKQ
jgi:hypothetical protein